ncbi:hypothetical protein [Microbacterium aurantiacum]
MPATHTVSPYFADGWGDAFTVMSTRAVSDITCMTLTVGVASDI